MSLEARLERCKTYLDQALKQPKVNRLYIDDLNLSIAMFEQAVKLGSVEVQKGFVGVDSEEWNV